VIGDSGEHSRLLQRLWPFVARNQNEFSCEVIARGRAQNRAALRKGVSIRRVIIDRGFESGSERGSKNGKKGKRNKKNFFRPLCP
jgi:hypothetical protein